MTLDERIDAVREATGYDGRDDRPVLEHDGWTYGDRAIAAEDLDGGIVEHGEEGFVVIYTTGAPEHGNVRTRLGFVAEGSDCPVDVSAGSIERLT